MGSEKHKTKLFTLYMAYHLYHVEIIINNFFFEAGQRNVKNIIISCFVTDVCTSLRIAERYLWNSKSILIDILNFAHTISASDGITFDKINKYSNMN